MTPQWPDAVPANFSIIAPPNATESSPQRSFAVRPAKVNAGDRSSQRVRDSAARENDRASFRRLIEADTRRSRASSDDRRTESSTATPTSKKSASNAQASREAPDENSRLNDGESPQVDPVTDDSPGEEAVTPSEQSVVSELPALPLVTEPERQSSLDGAAIEPLLLSGISDTELDRDLAELFALLGGEEAGDVPLGLPLGDVESSSLSSDLLPSLEESSKDGLGFLISLSSGGPDALSAEGVQVSGTPEGRFSSGDAVAALQSLPLGQGPLVSAQPLEATDAAPTSAGDAVPQNPAALADSDGPLLLPGARAAADAGNATLSEGSVPLTPAANLSAAVIAQGQADQTGESDGLAADAELAGEISTDEPALLRSETNTEASNADARSTGAFRSSPNNAAVGTAPGSILQVPQNFANLGDAKVAAQSESASGEEADLSASRIDGAEFAVTGSRPVSRNAAATATDFASRLTDQIAETIVTRAVTTQVGESLTLDAILDPPELGRLHFRITRSESGLKAVVTAENGEVQQVIAEQTTAIEQTVRTALNNDDSMQFQTADTPFDDGTSTAQDQEQPQRPGTLDNRTTSEADEADESPRERKTSQAEVDVLA